jgi:hypothetical protein
MTPEIFKISHNVIHIQTLVDKKLEKPIFHEKTTLKINLWPILSFLREKSSLHFPEAFSQIKISKYVIK